MTAVAADTGRTARRQLSGGAVFMASAVMVHGGNYLFNLVLGRQLGPALFSELSLIVTFMLIVTFAATTVQTTAARFRAVTEPGDATVRLHGWLLRAVRPAAVGLAAVFVIGAPLLAGAFRLSSALPLVVFGIGIPVYLSQAVHRGIVQGEARFLALAGSYQAEMWVRLIGGVAFVALGWSVAGAAGALTLSLAASWLVARRPLPEAGSPPLAIRREVRIFAGRSALLLGGEMLICHSDLIIAKLSFDPATAGSYAAISLIGRIAFFGTWPVVAYMFPIAARRHAAGLPTGRLLAAAVALVASVSALLTALAVVAPEGILNLAFGPGFDAAAPWLWPYVAATGCFAVASTVLSYHLAQGATSGALLVLGAGVAQVVSLSLLHGSVATLVWVQVPLMVGLLAATVAWHQRIGRRR